MLSYGFSKFLVLGHGFVLYFVICSLCMSDACFYGYV